MPYDIDRMFTYQRPTEDQIPKYEAINEAAKQLARVIQDRVPEGEDQHEAIKLVSLARMVANRGIAVDGVLTVEGAFEKRLIALIGEVEKWDYVVTKITVHPAKIRLFRSIKGYDENNSLLELRSGFIGRLWGAEVWVSKNLTPSEILLTPELTGKNPGLEQRCASPWTL